MRGVSATITINGRTQSLTEWARDYRIDPNRVGVRIRNGWEIEKALAMPPRTFDTSDLTGKQFGNITVLGLANVRDSNNFILWNCRCKCGRLFNLNRDSLKKQKNCSCGRGSNLRTHGLTKRKEYRAWRSMLLRCNYPNHKSYKVYGGRGVKVCERWLAFKAFWDDMGPRPSPTHSLDRIDNDGNYEPHNCRWATREEQQRNKRNNHLVTYNGETKCVAEWAILFGITAIYIKVS